MRAEAVDPRASQSERDEAAYRVTFWQQLRTPDGGWAGEEWRLTEADIRHVLEWADRFAADRYVTAWVETIVDGEIGLVRLLGWEPTRAEPPPRWVASA